MARTIHGDPDRYVDTYWSRFPGRYFPGDGCKRDEEGYYWLLGRVDDIMLVSGHNISTTEVESALVSHPAVAEAAVVGRRDEITGQAIAAFVTLRGTQTGDSRLLQNLRTHVRKGDRPDRQPQVDRFHQRSAQDPIGKDHAPPAQGHLRTAATGRRDHARQRRRGAGNRGNGGDGERKTNPPLALLVGYWPIGPPLSGVVRQHPSPDSGIADRGVVVAVFPPVVTV